MVAISRRGRNTIDVLGILFFTAAFFIPVTAFIGEFVHIAHPSRLHEPGEWLRPRLDWGFISYFLIFLIFVFIEEMLVGAWPVSRVHWKKPAVTIILLIAGSAIATPWFSSGGDSREFIKAFIDIFPWMPLVMLWLALPLIFCYIVRSLMFQANKFMHELYILTPAVMLLLAITYLLSSAHGTGDGETQAVIALTIQPVSLALVVGTARDLVMRKVVEPMVGEDAGEGMAGSA